MARCARVAPDSAHPSWSLALPHGAPVPCRSARATCRPTPSCGEGDTVKVLAPIAPGQKQLVARVSGRSGRRHRSQFAVGAGGAPLNLLVEERDAKVSGGTLALADSQVIEGRSFRRWTGRVPAGGTVTLALSAGASPRGGCSRRSSAGWASPSSSPRGGCVVGRRRLRRRARRPTACSTRSRRSTPATRTRATRHPDGVGGSYQAERARLKAELEAALAARKSSSYT